MKLSLFRGFWRGHFRKRIGKNLILEFWKEKVEVNRVLMEIFSQNCSWGKLKSNFGWKKSIKQSLDAKFDFTDINWSLKWGLKSKFRQKIHIKSSLERKNQSNRRNLSFLGLNWSAKSKSRLKFHIIWRKMENGAFNALENW